MAVATRPSSAPSRVVMRGIHKRFPGIYALRDTSLTIEPGEVHALVGENGSGKSTLVKVLAGHHRPDEGQVLLDGVAHAWASPAEALRHGIAVVSQELDLAPDLTVAENICMGTLPVRSRTRSVDWRAMTRAAAAALEPFGVRLPLQAPVSALGLEERQLVEAARALRRAEQVWILDEVTSLLGDDARARLFGAVRAAADAGISVLVISHHLQEVFEHADRATVLRDGQTVGTVELPKTAPETVVRMMVGREIEAFYVRTAVSPGPPVLWVSGLSSDGGFTDVSFSIGQGMVVGLAGLMGSGRSELCEALFGLRPLTAGTIGLGGEPVSLKRPSDAIRAGIGYAPADRKAHSTLGPMSVRENISVAVWRRLSRFGWLDRRAEAALADRYIADLDIRAASRETPIATLSGGNQQKAVLARWLAAEPRVYVLNEPTRGIDIAAKISVYRLIDQLRRDGRSLLISSSDLLELIEICDRVLVMFAGRLVADIDARTGTEEQIAHYMTGAFEGAAGLVG